MWAATVFGLMTSRPAMPATFSIELSNGYEASGNVTSGRRIRIKPGPPRYRCKERV